MARMTAADAAVAILRAEGVTHAFGVPGAAINPFYAAMRRDGTIDHVLARHVEGDEPLALQERRWREGSGGAERRERRSRGRPCGGTGSYGAERNRADTRKCGHPDAGASLAPRFHRGKDRILEALQPRMAGRPQLAQCFVDVAVHSPFQFP